MLIKDIMTKDVITVSPDASLKEIGSIFREKRINGIPVVDRESNVIGIVTVDDILRVFEEILQWQQMERKSTGLNLSDLVGKERLNTRAGSIMTKSVFTLDENKRVEDVMQLMFSKKIHTIPITRDNKLVGIIGKHDLVSSCFWCS